jgi:pSer/pThr/pTyr-binding forkhead associated (FHA) protein
MAGVWRVRVVDRQGREVGSGALAADGLTIGRDSDRQLILQSPSVSRRHARIILNGDQPCIIDEGSANGVLVDGARITAPMRLAPGARVEISDFRILFEPATQAVQSHLSQGTTEPSGGLWLVAEGGPYNGRIFEIPLSELAVGRAVDSGLVLDEPSLSRQHARLRRDLAGRIVVEDLGSSNGTFVNSRRVERGMAVAGDTVRFGELRFRVEDEVGGTRAASSGGTFRLVAFFGGGILTFLLLIGAAVMTLKRPSSVKTSGKELLARLSRQAESHLQLGKSFYDAQRYAEAKIELDAALELDPANLESRQLRALAIRAPEEGRTLSAAIAGLTVGDRPGIDKALRLSDELSPSAPARAQLIPRVGDALIRYGLDRCGERDWADCAWGLCRAFEVTPEAARGNERVVRSLRDAEKKLQRDRSHVYLRCRTLP